MKIKILFIISFLIIGSLFVGLKVLAQEQVNTTADEDVAADEEIVAEDLDVSDPIILSTNPFYAIKNLWWKIRTKLTFNPVKKAELQLKIASQRLIEAKKLAEKTGNEQNFQEALDKFQQEMEIVKNRIESLQEKAADNPKIDKFLDNFVDKIAKQERLMTRLELQLSDKPEVLEKIRQNRERIIAYLGIALNQLDDKDKISGRLEKNLENIEGSKYKNFKNLEVLLKLENKVPEQARDAIKQAQENALKRLHEDLNNMSSEDQAKFKDYLEKININQNTQLQIIDRLRKEKSSSALKDKLNQIREEIQKLKK